MRQQDEIEQRLACARQVVEKLSKSQSAPMAGLVRSILSWVLDDGSTQSAFIDQAFRAWEAELIGDRRRSAQETTKLVDMLHAAKSGNGGPSCQA